jgi:hypothetical protein
MRTLHAGISLIAAALVGCGGESTPNSSSGSEAPRDSSTDDFAREVVARMGKGYELGSPMLRDSVISLARQSGCHSRLTVGTDRTLSGSVAIWVNMGIIGSDVIRVLDSRWSSTDGSVVDTCLTEQARNWRFDSSFGKPGGYVVQVLFK